MSKPPNGTSTAPSWINHLSKAVEQLGSDKIEVRLGGIYALERIAQDSDRDHWTIMEVLTSFIQEKTSMKLITGEKIRARADEIQQEGYLTGLLLDLPLIRQNGSTSPQ